MSAMTFSLEVVPGSSPKNSHPYMKELPSRSRKHVQPKWLFGQLKSLTTFGHQHWNWGAGVEMLQVKPLWFPPRRKTSYNKKKLPATRNGSIHVMSTTTGYAWDIFSFAGILVLRECLGDLPWPSFSSFFLRILVLWVCLGHLQFCGNAWETFSDLPSFIFGLPFLQFFSFVGSSFYSVGSNLLLCRRNCSVSFKCTWFGDGCFFWRTRYL